MIAIKCENDNFKYEFELGTSLKSISQQIVPNPKYPILGARINNEVKELAYEIYKPKHLYFFDITDPDGMAMYQRSLTFVLVKAVKEKFPTAVTSVKNSISKGLYCEIDLLKTPITEEDVADIKNKMTNIINDDIPFIRQEMETTDAIKIFDENRLFEKSKLFKSRLLLYTSVYYLDKTVGYFYGTLVPSTGYLKVFDLVKYHDGILLRFPKASQPDEVEEMVKQDKIFGIFQEHKKGAKILGIEGVGSLNECIKNNTISEIIKISEALHEKKIAYIADDIHRKRDNVKLVLISGPSSSGKTTFCKRLSIQLRIWGFKPIMLSLDDYFVDREQTPKDENGDYDYECLEAIDVKLFNENLLDLMNGKEVTIPKFDFTTGKRGMHNHSLQMKHDNILVVEGIHGLNPGLTPMIDHLMKYKIYISALTQIAIDDHNRIPTTDNRLLRRIVRDYKYRNYSAYDTLNRWKSVRRGEDKNIFPYQEEADAVFNSALIYELGILKTYAEPILREVQADVVEYSEAKRLLKFISYFLPIKENEVPPTSLLREFLGGSSFKY